LPARSFACSNLAIIISLVHCFACRDVVGAALKTLGLGFNATAADIRRCGLSEQDVRSRVQRFVNQVKWRRLAGHWQAILLAAGCITPASHRCITASKCRWRQWWSSLSKQSGLSVLWNAHQCCCRYRCCCHAKPLPTAGPGVQ
jgi:hypothetical protein